MGRFTILFRSFTFKFTLVKVKKVLSHRVNFTSSKKLSLLKNGIVKLAL